MEFASVAPACLASPLRLDPFPAVLMAPGRVGDPGAVRALGRPYAEDGTRLDSWVSQGLVKVDDTPALLVHEYSTGGLTIRGLVGALDLTHPALPGEDPALWPHERVHPDQVEDLSSRMDLIGLNPAPILLSVTAPEGLRRELVRITEAPPAHAYTDRTGQAHRIWSVTLPADIDRLQRLAAESHALLADGHHRYAAYLALRDRHPGTAWSHGLAMLVDQSDTPFFLGPIHRVLESVKSAAFVDAAERLGASVRRGSRPDALDRFAPGTLVVTDHDEWVTLTPDLAPGTLVLEWLHEQLLPALGPVALTHHHSLDAALRAAGPGDLTVILPAPALATVTERTRAGHLLPEKATSFQPKPTMGAVMRSVTAHC